MARMTYGNGRGVGRELEGRTRVTHHSGRAEPDDKVTAKPENDIARASWAGGRRRVLSEAAHNLLPFTRRLLYKVASYHQLQRIKNEASQEAVSDESIALGIAAVVPPTGRTSQCVPCPSRHWGEGDLFSATNLVAAPWAMGMAFGTAAAEVAISSGRTAKGFSSSLLPRDALGSASRRWFFGRRLIANWPRIAASDRSASVTSVASRQASPGRR